MTITQHKADELFTKLVEAQAPVRPERLAEIQVAAESGWELAGDYIHLARAWLASQQALRDVIAENAALRARVDELEAALEDYHQHIMGGTLVWQIPPTDYHGEGVA